MKRLCLILLAAASACAPEQAADPEVASPRVYAEHWFAGAPGDVLLNIHETEYGFSGRLMDRNGESWPVRNIVMDGQTMAFMAPAKEWSWTASATPDGGWAGKWSEGGREPEDAVLTAIAAPAAAPAPEGVRWEFVRLPDGRQIYLDCRGSGSPAVIFDAGAGGWATSWSAVHDAIATTTLACAYDRAGHGLSDPRPLPLDAANIADDLDALLTAAGIPAPYVLVGHSLGSYHVRQYANTRFDKMAGMVLVDPSGDGQNDRFAPAMPNLLGEIAKRDIEAKAANCSTRLREKLVLRSDPLFITCKGTNDPDVFEQTESEIDSMPGASTQQLTASRRSYGDMPLIVLTRGDYLKGMPANTSEAERAGMKSVWIAMHEEMTALSSVGERRTIEGAGHFIQGDNPQAVIDAVGDVVARARATQR